MRNRLLLMLVLGAVLLSCGRPPPPEKPIDKLYRELSERREEFPVDAVRGKIIVIDPGHGGRFSGTTGEGGLREKDVNLGVALYLWGLLRDAGADARLTRTIDRDLLATDEGKLADDLAARVALADSLDADLFLSIHHNARADTNRSVNQIEVYYSMGDPGASVDAARAIYRHLMRNLGIERGKVLPGNFYVLRENRRPAVLGESSYLSHPPMEKKLALGEKRRLEAEAYFLGIVTYFSRGIPGCLIESPPERVTASSQLLFHGSVRDEEGYGGVDPATVRATLDGEPLLVGFDAPSGIVEAPLPAHLSPGEHRIALMARNLEGNAAPREEMRFEVAFPPARASLDAVRLPDGSGALQVAIHLFDNRGHDVADGTGVHVDPGGAAARTEGGAISLRLETALPPDTLHLSGEDFAISVALPGDGLAEPAGLLIAQYDDKPIAGASVWRNGTWQGRTGPGGWLPLDTSPAEEDLFRVEFGARRAGRRTQTGGVIRALFEPTQSLPLKGAAVAIDPAGTPESGLFPEADQSLAVALYLEEMVRWAGGEPHLTRTGPALPRDSERVSLARQVSAAYWITIEAGDSLEVTHFPGSGEGTPTARAVADALSRAFQVSVRIRTGAVAVLRDTPCPAIIVTVPRESRDGRLVRARLRRAAQAIHEGLSSRLAGDSPSDPLVITPIAPGALVRIDQAATFQAVSGDSLLVRYPPPGEHTLAVEDNGTWREIILP